MASQTFVRFRRGELRFFTVTRCGADFHCSTGYAQSLPSEREAAMVADAVLFRTRGKQTRSHERKADAQAQLDAWRATCATAGWVDEVEYSI